MLIQAWRAWGTVAFDRVIGMFAFAPWDARSRRVLLVGDRLGSKPLPCAFHEGVLSFDSRGVERVIAAARVPVPSAIERLWYLFCFERWFARGHRGEPHA